MEIKVFGSPCEMVQDFPPFQGAFFTVDITKSGKRRREKEKGEGKEMWKAG